MKVEYAFLYLTTMGNKFIPPLKGVGFLCFPYPSLANMSEDDDFEDEFDDDDGESAEDDSDE